MHFSQLLAAPVLLAGWACAQSATSSSSASSSTSGSVVHVVQVSDPNGALTFIPNAINAQVGDLVQWQFYPGNHSVALSEFFTPCQPTDQSKNSNAFFSGFMPLHNKADGGRLTYTVQVKDTKPLWYYCSQSDHCKQGMVGVINPPKNSPQSIQAYAAAAQKVTAAGVPSSSTSGTPSSTGASPSATTSHHNGASNVGSSKNGLLAMAIALGFAFAMS